jgi:2-amino-4-hydroxy-6-hydroxymethyldihydropteridine diphosphokinase
MTQRVYLSLGSNLGDRAGNLQVAINALRQEMRITAVSSLYETEPVGVLDQPSFYNLALAVQTDLAPANLLATIKCIEWEVGRRPTIRWGPRIVDIDILLYGDLVLDTPQLVIPHPEMPNRAFVLVPLAEIAPDAIHPTLGTSMAELRDQVPGLDTVRRVKGD